MNLRLGVVLMLFGPAALLTGAAVAGSAASGAAAVPAARGGAAAPTAPAVRTAADRPEEGRTFSEPLVAVGEPAPDDTYQLAAAVRAYRAAADIEAVGPLTAFLERHPGSAWAPSLETNLAVLYRHTGYLDRALAAAGEAWRRTAPAPDPEARKIADAALAVQIEIDASLGRTDELAALLDAAAARPLAGHVAEIVSGARSSLWEMRHDPGSSFRCGPLALERVAEVLHPGAAPDPRVLRYRSTRRGTSLAELVKLAQQAGLGLHAVKREPGSPIPVPAVLHWKADHFAAVVAQQGARFLVKDMTFGDDRWLSRAAVEEESSGYLLASVPRGVVRPGWRAVPDAEAAAVHGQGAAANPNPGATTPADPKKPGPCGGSNTGMPVYNFHMAPVSLNVTDVPVAYTPPVGPAMQFGVTYNSREDFQPQTFTFTNLGSRWNFDWLSYVEDDNPMQTGGTIRVAERGGGSYILAQVSTTLWWEYGPNVSGSHETAMRLTQDTPNGPTTTGFQRVYPDGSVETYGQSDGATTMRKYFLTQVTDPYGNSVNLAYDGSLRLATITDPLGQQTTLSYGLSGDSYKVTAVTDPFGRQAVFQYANGALQSVTDAMGMTSSFTYGPTAPEPPGPLCTGAFGVPTDFMNAMTTPYGTTAFGMGEAPPCVNTDLGDSRWLVATDPLGNAERIEFTHEAQNVPETTTEPIPTGFGNENLAYRNTYYWNQTAMQSYNPSDSNRYLNATYTIHWVRDASESETAVSSIPGFVQPLGERRMWFSYPGETADSYQGTLSTPSTMARVLDNGQQQVYSSSLDGAGRPQWIYDPVGRKTSFVYAPPSYDDVSAVINDLHETVASFTYNGNHRPLTYTDYAGQTYTMTYNAFGELTSVKRPDGVTTNYTYDGRGFLTNLAIAGTQYQETYTYDGANRLATWTSTDGYTLSFRYDNLDRLIEITYPDGSADQVVFKRLDVVAAQDRMGRVTTYDYDAADRLMSMTDPLGRTTTYSWCGCGALSQVADPRGNLTTWMLDGLNRVVGKQVNGQTVALYNFDSAGRLVRRTDGLNQVTSYSYTIDNLLSSTSYQNTAHPTPNVQYEYDPNLPRLLSMTDGVGTTTYTYNPGGVLGAGQIASVTAPAPSHTITYQYDVLERQVGQTLDGVSQARTFDSQDRLATMTSPLGRFTASYDGASNRMTALSYPNGQGPAYSYMDAAHDFRLSQVTWGAMANGYNLSQFTYSYDPAHQQIVGLTWHDINNPSGRFFNFSYDGAQQLLARRQTTDPAQSPVMVLRTNAFTYDASGNRTSEIIDSALSTATFDGANQLLSLQSGLTWQAQRAVQTERLRSPKPNPPQDTAAARATSSAVQEGGHEN